MTDRRISAVIIGAGHSGLAMSRCLAERAIDHVVLERGEVANTWKTERWESLRLLTPNWLTRLPGDGYDGRDPDGFRNMAETVAFIEDYARAISAPLRTGARVSSVVPDEHGYAVATDSDLWRCRTVVLATGGYNIPLVPAAGASVPPDVDTLTADRYRNPQQLADGGVLVVGASATGAQVADEIQRSGRQVTLAVGEHVRVPRTYRGRDILWWLDAAGVLDERYDAMEDLNRARNLPSFQLAGYADRRVIDLNALAGLGVKLIGRLAAFSGGKAQFSGSLRNVCALADLKMNRLLNTIDEWAGEHISGGPPPERFAPTVVEASPPLVLDLARAGIKTILWATGFRPDYSWLRVPVFDHKGRVRHDGGIAEAPGMYIIGLPFLRRRKSSLIAGAADDARDLSEHLAGYVRGQDRSTRPARDSVS